MIVLAGVSRGAVDFNREIRPILNKECISCHGGVKRAGELSLQYREDALKPGESGVPGIVPGKPEKSEMFLRLFAEDSSERMPRKAPALKPDQVAKIKQWIAEGAQWADHWAYTPLRKPAVPQIPNVQPIDAFARQRLALEKLGPAPEASRSALLRRVALDLTGLPPTLAEVAAFEGDQAAGAYERQVDRLLASPHFGERLASLWMDLARYSDSKGYEADRSRPMWPYRDWLVNAFNADLPFDQFTIKQLAGDLLPKATEEDRIATAMHRLTSTNDEGGTDDEEFRTSAVLDRVNTTWEAWMGTSMGCAQCHDHPYDPFRQKEFYESVAFFNNTADSDKSDESPTLEIRQAGTDKARLAALDEDIAKLDAERESLTRESKSKNSDGGQPLSPFSVVAGAGLKVTFDNGAIHLTGTAPPADTTTVLAPMTAERIGAIRLDTLPQANRPGNGAGLGSDGNFVLTGIEVSLMSPSRSPQVLDVIQADADFEQGGYPVASVLKNLNPDRMGWAVSPQVSKPHYAIFRFKKTIQVPADSQLQIRLLHQHTQNGQYQGASIGSFRLSTLADASMSSDPGAKRLAELDRTLKSARKNREALVGKGLRLPVMVELTGNNVRKTHAFVRGNWMTKGDEVFPSTPKSMPGFPAGAPRNRLGLAQWIMAKDNPLTARVAVNRIWEQFFGIGLVETAEDFGTKGEAPTHPELLDWLAASFRDDFRWSTKRFIREIVLSHAYRQDNRATPALIERDPRNILLARGPRVRLTAEMVRDSALAMSGLLNRSLGGPSVMPPLPSGVMPPSPYNGENWITSPGADRYRRAIYTFWKRSNPYPSLITFDSAERTLCASRRLRTNTPLQALVTLNDPVYVEAAQALARRMQKEGGTTLDTQMNFGWRLVTLSAPPPGAAQRLAGLYRDSLSQFQKDSAASKQLAPTAEEAAMTNVASVLLNLDQVLTK